MSAPQPLSGAQAPLDLDADAKEHRFYRDALIEDCAKAVEEIVWTLPLYAPTENINVATGEAANIVIRQAAEAVRALALPSTACGGEA